MRKMTTLIAVTAVTVFIGLGPAASAQTASTLPGIPTGQGGPDNQVNSSQGGDAPGGRNNPAVNSGPATAEDDDASLAPWLVGAALLVALAAGGLIMARRTGRNDAYESRQTLA